MKRKQQKPMSDPTCMLPRGVLKVKKGFNPNSSSIGTVVYSFPFAYAAVSAVVVVLAALVGRRRRTRRKKGGDT